MSELEELKLRLNITGNEKDELLKIILGDSKSYILKYTSRELKQWRQEFRPIQMKIGIFEYNRIGVENLKNQSEGSVSNSYMTSYPREVTALLNPYRLGKCY